MGANRVFIRSTSDVNVTTILHEAKDFFDHFVTNIVRLDKNVVPFQWGVWLRLYGVPLHAWNESFFKLCIFECGRFLRSNYCSMEKERFDYARILIATSRFEIINCLESILIDGELVTMKIVEDWGFNIGDDACLFEEGDGSVDEQAHHEDVRLEQDMDANVELLVDKILHDLVESEGNNNIIDDKVKQAGTQGSKTAVWCTKKARMMSVQLR